MATRRTLEEAALVLENEGQFYRELQELYTNSDVVPTTVRSTIKNHARKAGFGGLTEADAESLRRYFEDSWSLNTCLLSCTRPSYDLLEPEVPKDPESQYLYWLKPLLEIPSFKAEFLARPNPRRARDLMLARLRALPNGTTNASQRETLRLWLCNHFGVKTQPDISIAPAFDWESILLDPTAAQPQPQETPTMNTKPFELTTKTYLNGTDLEKLQNAEIYDLIQAQEAEIEKLQAIKAKPKSLLAEVKKRQEGITALVAYLDSK